MNLLPDLSEGFRGGFPALPVGESGGRIGPVKARAPMVKKSGKNAKGI
jgi:hypothetical protein